MVRLHKYLKRNKCIILAAILVFIYSSCSNPRNTPDQESVENAPSSSEIQITEDDTPSPGSESQRTIPEGSSQKMDTYFENLGDALAEIPKDTFDLEAVVDMIGTEPAALFEWVRDNTFLVSYRGILRGPTGVLMDRVGNSLDRALLLYELMRSAGHEVQLASGIFLDDQAAEIKNKARPFPLDTIQESAQLSSQDIDDLVKVCSLKYQMDEAETRGLVQKLIEGQRRLEKKLKDSVALQTSSIQKSIEKYRDRHQENPEPDPIASKDHWWVQWNKDDSWLDLDPTLADAQFGQALTEARHTYQHDEIDEDLYHHLAIRVIIERWEKGHLEEDTVLEHQLDPYQVVGQRVSLLNVPLNWPPENLSEEKDFLKAQQGALNSMSEWMPVLTVGTDEIKNFSFTSAGEINENPGKKQKKGRSSGLLGGFSTALGPGESKEEPNKETMLTAEWIEYELSSPGQPARKIRRPVFDGLGPAARSGDNVAQPPSGAEHQTERNLTLSLSSTEIFPQVCRFSPDFFAHELATALIQNRSMLTDISFRRETLKIDEDLGNEMKQLPALPSPLSLFIMSRLEFSRLKQFYLEKPNLFSLILEPSMDAQGNVSFRFVLDILANEWAVYPLSGSTVYQARLEQGVLETNLEAHFWGPIGRGEQNTAQLFEQSLRQGEEWVLIRDDRDPNWKKVRLPANACVLINENLKEGFWALVPQTPYSYEGKELTGWWRIHPETGDTLGIMESGRGQTLTNYAITVLKKGAPFWLMLGCKAADLKRGICDPCAIFAFSLLWTAGKALISLANWVQGEIATIAIFKVFVFKGPAWLSLLLNSLNLLALVGSVDPCLKTINS